MLFALGQEIGGRRIADIALRIPTIRLLLLITDNPRTFSVSMCLTALAKSSSSRQQ
jgi:hypothetical protein